MPKIKKSKIFDHVILKFTLGLIVVLFFIGAFFWFAGRFDWIAGWAYIGLLICGQGLSTAYLWRKSPDLLKRRGKLGKGTKNYDHRINRGHTDAVGIRVGICPGASGSRMGCCPHGFGRSNLAPGIAGL